MQPTAAVYKACVVSNKEDMLYWVSRSIIKSAPQ
jgi:hypothetical protein